MRSGKGFLDWRSTSLVCYINSIMKILITAGGTTEKIDDVRVITNSATGRLGAKIADAFAASVRPCDITYICSGNAARPERADVKVSLTSGVESVMEAVQRACAETPYDVIIHSMAISDYQVKAVLDSLDSRQDIREKKISSNREELVVVLKKAPKIIALLRGLAPGAVIVGFKLLSGAGEEDLIKAGGELLKKNDCDFVFANDISTINEDSHEGFLIKRDGTYEKASGKEEIAALIAERTLNR